MIDEKDYYIYFKKKINVKLLYMLKVGLFFVFCFFLEFFNFEFYICILNNIILI